jgi:hypothetical protein
VSFLFLTIQVGQEKWDKEEWSGPKCFHGRGQAGNWTFCTKSCCRGVKDVEKLELSVT